MLITIFEWILDAAVFFTWSYILFWAVVIAILVIGSYWEAIEKYIFPGLLILGTATILYRSIF